MLTVLKKIKFFASSIALMFSLLAPAQGNWEASVTYTEWKQSGHMVNLKVNAKEYRIFYRIEKTSPNKPWLTMTHGFPTNSYDFHSVFGELSKNFNLLTLDFLGFGASEKPRKHEYSLFEQTDILEALWKRLGIEKTFLFAHDFSGCVAQEILARIAEGKFSPVKAVIFSNGAIIPEAHKPTLIQKLFLTPFIGPPLASLMNRRLLLKSLMKTYGDKIPSQEELNEIWTSVDQDKGYKKFHRLLFYMGDRKRNRDRFVGALQHTKIPTRYLWGMKDPISGSLVVELLRKEVPSANITELSQVGHYPPLEDPQSVIDECREFFLEE